MLNKNRFTLKVKDRFTFQINVSKPTLPDTVCLVRRYSSPTTFHPNQLPFIGLQLFMTLVTCMTK